MMNALVRAFVLVCLGLILLPAIASSNCDDYGNHLYWVGGCDTPGDARAVVVDGTRAYIADLDGGLQVMDITNPQSPAVLIGLSTPGATYDLAPYATKVYLADGSAGLQIVDLSIIWNPRIIGSLSLPGTAYGIAIQDSHTFVACGPSGLAVINTMDPRNPVLLGRIDVPGDARRVAVTGDYAFVAAGASGLQVIDVADPQNPQRVGSLQVPGVAMDVCLSGDYAFVAADSAGFHVVDVRDPAHPALLGTVDTPGRALGVSTDDVRAYVADGASGIAVIDFQDPARPAILGSLVLTDPSHGIGLAGNYALVACGAGGLTVVDITNPFTPPNAEVIGSVIIPDARRPVVTQGSRVYLDSGIFYIIDVADPANPAVVGGLWTPDWTGIGPVVSGDYAYYTHQAGDYPGYGFLTVIDMTDAAHPRVGATLPLAESAGDIAVSGGYCYALTSSGLLVIDISSPLLPRVVGREGSVSGSRLAISGNHAYVAATDLIVVDITDPENPHAVGRAANLGGYRIAAANGHAYVQAGSYLFVLDVTDPQNPREVSAARISTGYTYDMVLAGTCLYFVLGEDGIRMVDVGDPAAPRIAGTIQTTAYGVGVGANIYAPDGFRFNVLPPQCRPISSEEAEAIAGHPGLRAFPNPFADRVTVDFGGGFKGPVLAEIFDVAGCRIRTLRDRTRDAARHDLLWDGRDDRGHRVGSGVYLIRVSSAGGEATARTVLLR